MEISAPAYNPVNLTVAGARETNRIVRFFKAGDELGITRLFWDVYQNTHYYSEGTDPARFRERVRQGKIISAVVAGDDNAILGHCALLRNNIRPDVMNVALALTDRRHRNQGMESRLLEFLIHFARRSNVRGIFSAALTHHPFAQMAGKRLGFRRMGLFVGWYPSSRTIDGIHVNEGRRQSGMAGYLSLFNREEHVLYLPSQHEDFIRVLLHDAGLKRRISRASAGNIPQNDFSFMIDRFPVDNRAIVRVSRYGPDLKTRMKELLGSLIEEKIEHITVHFKLSDIFVERACRICEDLGFFIGGIQPDSPIGDTVFLQYLHNISVDYSDIQAACDTGAFIKSYVYSHHIRQ